MLSWVKGKFILGLMLWGLVAAAIAGAEDLTPVMLDLPGGRVTLAAEIADTRAERSRGLMFREDFGPGDAMLFVYDAPKKLIFWMKDTPRALDIVYFDGEGRFINTHPHTEPFSLRSLPSLRAAQYALELSAGEAKTLGIGEGARLVLPLDLR